MAIGHLVFKLLFEKISNELSKKANSLKNNHYIILTVHNSKIHVNIYYDKIDVTHFVNIVLPIHQKEIM